MGFLIPPHPLTNFDIQKYYKNEPKFNGIFSRNNLHKKINDGAYVINLDKYKNVGMHWIALFCNKNTIIYFDSFGVEHIPKEIKKFIENKSIKTNIFRVQENDSIMYGYFVLHLLILCLQVKTNLFSPHDLKKKKYDDIILSYFKNE